MQQHDGALLGFAYVHDAEVETVGGESQAIAHADGELSQQRLLGGDAGAREGELESPTPALSSREGGIDDGAGLLEVAALALRIEAQGERDGVAGKYLGCTRVELLGLYRGAVAGGVGLRDGHGVAAGIAQPERAFLHTVSLLDGSEADGGKAYDDEGIEHHGDFRFYDLRIYDFLSVLDVDTLRRLRHLHPLQVVDSAVGRLCTVGDGVDA